MDEFFEADLNGQLNSGCDFFNAEGQITNELDKKIADDLTSTTAIPSDQYAFQKHLYRKLMNHPNAINEHPSYNSFLEHHKNKVIGQFNKVERQIELAISINEELQTYLNSLTQQTQDIYISIAKIDSLFSEDENDTSLEDLTIAKIDLMNQLEIIDLNYDSVNTINQEQMLESLNEAYEQNEVITTNEIFETNEQIVNRIYLFSLLNPNEELSMEQIEQLEIIAQQDPSESGFAVLRAFNLLPECRKIGLEIIRPEIIDTGKPVSVQQGKEKNIYLGNTTSKSGRIYPNPAKSSFFIRKITEEAGTLIISNLSGQILLEEQIGKEIMTQEIKHNLQNGVYFVTLIVKGEPVLIERLIVQPN